ncbi:MAG TPA: DNA adenine methylase [Archangium sp.]|uniref:DNA adenine methylase n=1 Tax=Archangium sp. TaxID=1872627 RepID=UPI002E347008|nr:DNA adenine methylase [Archangium sp.]HEX5744836.1 DNA adenine methylase [Archangium sp.]
MSERLQAPFPWMGGKSRAAQQVWDGLGDVPHYVEPFAGSLAVLLARPTAARSELVNDKDCFIANFWRAVKHDPEAVAHYADWPANEADLHARHAWLVARADFRERMHSDPEHFDAKVAGWWVWGVGLWIGSGWCSAPAWAQSVPAGGGEARARDLATTATHRRRPNVGRGHKGVHRRASALPHQSPRLSGHTGVHRDDVAGDGLVDWMNELAQRLRRATVCCGDWTRVLTPCATTKVGVTGVLLDPPYSAEAGRDPSIYAEESLTVAHEVRAWALSNGDNPALRIVLCGLEGEHDMPATWRCEAWTAPGGYAAARGNRTNALRERLWFSPYCLAPRQPTLFDTLERCL